MGRENLRVVGVADMIVTGNSEDMLITYSLGSCVGLAVYDAVANVGGLLHAQLPLSANSRDKAQLQPAMFVDTGVADLLGAVLKLGARRQSLVACVAGAASHLDDNGFFAIGRRNYTVLRKILWKNEILIHAEEVGGTVSRTLSLDMGDGRIVLSSGGKRRELYSPPDPRGGTRNVV